MLLQLPVAKATIRFAILIYGACVGYGEVSREVTCAASGMQDKECPSIMEVNVEVKDK